MPHNNDSVLYTYTSKFKLETGGHVGDGSSMMMIVRASMKNEEVLGVVSYVKTYVRPVLKLLYPLAR
jgi:hypothetical protein